MWVNFILELVVNHRINPRNGLHKRFLKNQWLPSNLGRVRKHLEQKTQISYKNALWQVLRLYLVQDQKLKTRLLVLHRKLKKTNLRHRRNRRGMKHSKLLWEGWIFSDQKEDLFMRKRILYKDQDKTFSQQGMQKAGDMKKEWSIQYHRLLCRNITPPSLERLT